MLRVIRSIDAENGGPIEGIRQITPHLNERNVRTTVVSLDGPTTKYNLNEPFKILLVGPGHGKYGYNLNLISKLRELSNEHDVIIVEGIWQYHSYATRKALKKSDKKYYVYTHGMLDPWFKKNYPIKHLKKLIYWRLAESKVLREAESILYTTEKEKKSARETFNGNYGKDRVVGYGTSEPPTDIEKQKKNFLERYPMLKDKRIILFLGRIHEKKGIKLLIEAYAKTIGREEKTMLVIVGPDQGGYKKKMQRKAKELNISKQVLWTGMLTGVMKWGAFRSAELFCLPSHQENFGVAVAEALACGLAVSIAEPVNISSEVDAYNAGIVHKDNIEGTIYAFERWVKMTIEEKNKMRSNARILFEEKYNFASVANRIYKVLEESVKTTKED